MTNKSAPETQGTPLKITKTDTLVMEYVELPLKEPFSFVHFLYRFVEPEPLVWQEGSIKYPDWVDNEDKGLKAFGLKYWESKITSPMSTDTEVDDATKKSCLDMMNVKDIKIVECHMVPVKRNNGTWTEKALKWHNSLEGWGLFVWVVSFLALCFVGMYFLSASLLNDLRGI